MAEKKKILYIVEAMGGGVFTYIVDLTNELVDTYDMYIAYAVRKQTPSNYKDYFDKRIHLIEVKNFARAINATKDIAAFFEIRKIAKEIKPDIIHLHSSKAGALGRFAFSGKRVPLFYTPHGYSFLMQNSSEAKRKIYKGILDFLFIKQQNKPTADRLSQSTVGLCYPPILFVAPFLWVKTELSKVSYI